MKTLVTVLALLAFASSAFAAKAKPQDFPDIIKWTKLHGECTYGEPTQQGCDAAEALGKKLVARGYCLYGHGTVGRTGRKYFYPGIDSAGTNSHWTRHCYTVTNMPEK